MRRRFLTGCIICMGVLCSVFVSGSKAVDIFNTLSDVKSYAETLPEYPVQDQSALTSYSFKKFYTSRVPGYFKTLLSLIGLQESAWKEQEFQKLFQEVIEKRRALKYSGHFVSIVKPKPESKFFIISGLNASFHSFIRCLDEFKKLGVIDDNFKIHDAQCYIVFNGEMITKFSYGLDTLTLILRLMHENPEQVYYIRGVSEETSEWADNNIGEESAIRIQHIDWDVLNDLMIRFVDTLPSALYLVAEYSDDSMNLVCICGRDLDSKYFEEKRLSVYFTNPDISIININEQEGSVDKKIKISSVVSTEYFDMSEYARTEGLRRAAHEKGSVGWHLVSGPTNARRVFNGFFYDAFVVLTTADDIQNWTITLYGQDVRYMSGIYPKAMYNLVTGKKLTHETIRQRQLELLRAQKKDLDYALQNALNEVKLFNETEVAHVKVDVDVTHKKEIVFGSLMDLSRNQQGISRQSMAGINLVFNAINKKGGVHGRRLSLVVLDDEYDPAKSRVQIRALMDEYKIYTLLMPLGSPTLESYLDLVKEQKICVLFPNTGSSLFRDPQLKYLINFRASYAQEGQALGRYALEVLKAKKIVLFYQEDVESIDGILNYFKGANFSNFSKITYGAKEITFEKQIREINKIQPDTFIFLSLPTTTYELMRQMGVENFAEKNLLGWSDLISETFQNFVRSRGLRLVLSSIVPNPSESELPLVKEYRQDADAKGIVKDGDSLEGFINAHIIVKALKEITGTLTCEKLIEKIEQFKNYDLGGITLNFEPLSRQLSSSVWLNTGKKEWERIEVQPIVSSVADQKTQEVSKESAETQNT